MKGLAALKREKAEREARKAEKERLKLEKKKEKEREARKRKVYKAYITRKRNQRRAESAKILKERQKSGDERGYYTILLTRNNKRIQRLGAKWWRNDALKLYHELIEKNRQEVDFPVEILTSHIGKSRKDNKTDARYEILMIKKTKDDEEAVSQFRDDYGKYKDTVVTGKGKESHIIVAKDEWLVEETFNVYGYHPVRDRKTYRFIYDELVMSDIEGKADIKRIMTFHNKLLIEQGMDFDLIICKNADECRRLCNKIFKDIEQSKNKLVFYGGEAKNTAAANWVERIMEKTGWNRTTVLKHTLI